MKRFLVKMMIISCSFVAINILFYYYIKFSNSEFQKVEAINNFKGKEYSCIIIGNSLALDGFDTKLLTEKGITSYNFAVAGATLIANLLILEKYLQNNSPPRVVALGIKTKFLNRNMDSRGINPLVGYFFEKRSLRLETLPVVQFKWLATDALKKMISSEHRDAEMILGQYRISRAVPDKTKLKVQQDPLDYENISGSSDLKRLAQLAKQYEFEIVIFEMPLFRDLRNSRPEIDKVEINGFAPIPIINVNNNEVVEGLLDPKKDWLGNSHLNVKGGEKFTEYVYSRYLFPVFSGKKTSFASFLKFEK